MSKLNRETKPETKLSLMAMAVIKSFLSQGSSSQLTELFNLICVEKAYRCRNRRSND